MLCILPPQPRHVFMANLSFAAKSPLSEITDRGRCYAVPPLVCRFLTKTASRSASTLLRDNGRTRHTPTAQKCFSEGGSGMYSHAPPAFSHRTKALFAAGMRATSSLQHCNDITLAVSIADFSAFVNQYAPNRSESFPSFTSKSAAW